MNIIIKKSDHTAEDFKAAAAIHRRELNEGFLSSLGDRALCLMFSFAAASQKACFYTAYDEESGQTVAFLLGTPGIGGFYKDFIRRKFFQAIFILKGKLFSFSRIKKILETLLYPAKKDTRRYPSAELLDIAVYSEFHGLGIARKLFNEFCAALKDAGIPEFKITTGESLHGAHKFYEKLGAVKVDEVEVHAGQKTFVYVYEIPK